MSARARTPASAPDMCRRCCLRAVTVLCCIASLSTVHTSGTVQVAESRKDVFKPHGTVERAPQTAFAFGLHPRLMQSSPAAISRKVGSGGYPSHLFLQDAAERRHTFGRLAMQENSDTERERLELLFRSDEGAATGSIPVEERIQRNKATTLAFGDELPDPRVLPEMFVWKPDPQSPILLPGLQQVLMVQEPHYCHMFETILSGPLPHRFVFLYASSSSDEDSSEPHLGVLAQVAACKRLDKNRLLLLVVGEARVAVTEETGLLVPFSRAACTVLPDDEEIEQYLELGTGSVMGAVRRTEHLSQDVLATVHDGYFTSAARITATAAAAAASLAWSELELPLAARRGEGSKLDSVADVVDLNTAVPPERVAERVAEAAGAAAAAVANRALREVGYRPMMHEADGYWSLCASRCTCVGGGVACTDRECAVGRRYEGDGLGSLEEEGLPPSWLVALDHYEERVGRGEGEGEGVSSEEEEEEGRRRAAPVLRVLSGKGVEVVREMERRVWVKLDEVMTLRAAVTNGGGGATRTLPRLPQQLSNLRPQRAHEAWPVMRRAARLSFAMAALLTGLGRAPEEGGATHNKLLRATSIEQRLEVVLGELQTSSAKLRAMLALRAASESKPDDDDLDDGYPSCTA